MTNSNKKLTVKEIQENEIPAILIDLKKVNKGQLPQEEIERIEAIQKELKMFLSFSYSNNLQRSVRILSDQPKMLVNTRSQMICTDGTTVFVNPVLAYAYDIEDLSKERKDAIIWGQAIHETGHLIFTNFNVLKQISKNFRLLSQEDRFRVSQLKTFFNLTEDTAIEYAMGNAYPGTEQYINYLNNIIGRIEPSLQEVEESENRLATFQGAISKYADNGLTDDLKDDIDGLKNDELREAIYKALPIMDRARYKSRTSRDRLARARELEGIAKPFIDEEIALGNMIHDFQKKLKGQMDDDAMGKGKPTPIKAHEFRKPTPGQGQSQQNQDQSQQQNQSDDDDQYPQGEGQNQQQQQDQQDESQGNQQGQNQNGDSPDNSSDSNSEEGEDGQGSGDGSDSKDGNPNEGDENGSGKGSGEECDDNADDENGSGSGEGDDSNSNDSNDGDSSDGEGSDASGDDSTGEISDSSDDDAQSGQNSANTEHKYSDSQTSFDQSSKQSQTSASNANVIQDALEENRQRKLTNEKMDDFENEENKSLISSISESIEGIQQSADREAANEAKAQKRQEKIDSELASQVKYGKPHEGIKLKAISNPAEFWDGGWGSRLNPERELENLKPIIGNMKKKLRDMIRYNLDIKHTGLNTGKINQKQLIRAKTDKLIFCKKQYKSQEADLAIQVLVDESGSMDGTRIKEATRACAILAEVCQSLNIPLAITGHDARGGSPLVRINHYVRFEKDIKLQKRNIWKINARDNTREGMSVKYAGEYLARQPQRDKLLIVISDGAPMHMRFHGHPAAVDAQQVVKELEKKYGITTIGVAIGDGSDEIAHIYKKFVSCRNIDELPRKLFAILKRSIFKV